MKWSFLFVLFFGFLCNLFSQIPYVMDRQLSDLRLPYIAVSLVEEDNSFKVLVDVGERKPAFMSKSSWEGGGTFYANSVIHLLKIMSKVRYEFKSTYILKGKTWFLLERRY